MSKDWDKKKTEKVAETKPLDPVQLTEAVEKEVSTQSSVLEAEDGNGARLEPPSIKDMVKDIIEGMMPAMVAAMRIGQQNAPQAAAPSPAAMQAFQIARAQSERALGAEKCHACGQKLHACKGKHVDMVVFPTRIPELAGAYPGVTINGVTYISANNQHIVTVPEALVDSIKAFTSGWEDGERVARLGVDKTVFNNSARNRAVAQQLGFV